MKDPKMCCSFDESTGMCKGWSATGKSKGACGLRRNSDGYCLVKGHPEKSKQRGYKITRPATREGV